MSSGVEPSKRERAIDLIEECKRIHADWATWQREAGAEWPQHVKGSAVGGPEHHEEWIKKYDLVLEVLRSA